MIVLDTHAWLWWVEAPERLGRAARRAIDTARSVGVPSVCCWELAWLVEQGRLDLDRPVVSWVRAALAQEGSVTMPLTPEIGLAAAKLDPESFPRDPADRFIYSTAVQQGARLATADAAITAFDPDRVVWS